VAGRWARHAGSRQVSRCGWTWDMGLLGPCCWRRGSIEKKIATTGAGMAPPQLTPCCPNPLVAGLVVVAPSLAPGEAGYLAMYYPLPGVRMPTPGYDTYLSRCHSPVPHTTTVVCDRSLCVHMWQCAVARCEFKSMPV
jgi:hypothetical protein